MPTLALLRHGHTPWNLAGQIQGSTDIPLEEDAAKILSGLCLPQPWQTADLVSSPLKRAVQTAELVSGRTPRRIDALTEMDWGDWEGKKGVELKADPSSEYLDIEHWGWGYRPPNGETPAEVRDRVQPWVMGVQRDTVAVCHIGIMRVILALATGWNFSGAMPFKVKRNRLFLVDIDAGELTTRPDQIRLWER